MIDSKVDLVVSKKHLFIQFVGRMFLVSYIYLIIKILIDIKICIISSTKNIE